MRFSLIFFLFGLSPVFAQDNTGPFCQYEGNAYSEDAIIVHADGSKQTCDPNGKWIILGPQLCAYDGTLYGQFATVIMPRNGQSRDFAKKCIDGTWNPH